MKLASGIYDCGPCGEVIRSTAPMAKINPLRFSTKYQDDESDLLYYGYRYYKPSTGSWLSPDLIEENDKPNVYCFIGNIGCNGVDFLGLATVEFKCYRYNWRHKVCRNGVITDWGGLPG